MMMGKHMSHGIADKIDMDVLDQIIALAESAMGKSVGKKKPDLTVMEVSMDKKPMEGEEPEMEAENEGEGESEDQMAMNDDDLEDLIEEYKKRKA